MTEKHNRRRFLQTSLTAGAALTVGAVSSSHGDNRPADPPGREANPPAPPGRVRWHENFGAACTAAERSGKPVFLFHMLGRLDEKFC
jgi:hypothetical protein